jgi:hypothetical protein
VAIDFALYWSASFLALSGEAGAVYDGHSLPKIEKDFTGCGPLNWPYPPTALLTVLPLALAPYFLSLAFWLTTTLAAYLLVLYKIAPHRLTLVWGITFFGTFANCAQGQNGFISAAFLGGGLLLLENSPLWGGLLLGLLSYKPHLAVLIPVALLAGRRWQALAGAMISGLGLILASGALFGLDLWPAFLKNMQGTMHNLHDQIAWFAKMPSVFAAARLEGLGLSSAWVLQGAVMLAAVALAVWLWSSPASQALKSAGLAIAILLFPPHIWHYDLTLLALALAWLLQAGLSQGWLPREQLLLLASWAFPLPSFFLSVDLKWPLGPIFLIMPLVLVLQRYSWEIHNYSSLPETYPVVQRSSKSI